MEIKFVPYEISLALKEKGFDGAHVSACYLRGKFTWTGIKNATFGEPMSDIVNAPMYQQVFDWLEKTHNLELNAKSWKYLGDELVWLYSVNKLKQPSTYRFEDSYNKIQHYSMTKYEAYDKAIKEAIKLIN